MSHEEPRRERRELRRDYERRRKKLSALLIRARKESGLNQKTVALMMGTSQPTIAKIEKSGRIAFVLLERLAAVYDLPLTYFATLDADTRSDGKYLGLTNQQWQEYHKLYNQDRNKGLAHHSVRTISMTGFEWKY